MNIDSIFDKFVSNTIVYASYALTIFTWYYLFYNSGNQINFLLFYFPYGIIIFAFLFFGNKVFFGLLFTYISLYFVLKTYNLNLPFNNFFVISACQLVSTPLTLFVLQKLNMTIGTNKNYRFDKTNIFHVLLITFYSTIMLGIIIVFSSLFFNNQTNILNFTAGNFIGAVILIVLMKILVNIPNYLISLIKSN